MTRPGQPKADNPWNSVGGGSAAALGAAAAAQEVIRQHAKRRGAPGEVPDAPKSATGLGRTDIAGSPPSTPPSEPRDPIGPGKTEFPAEPPFQEIDLSNPIPEDIEPGIYIHPMPPEDLTNGTIVERKGNEATRKELERIRDYYEGLGWEHIKGGRYSSKNKRGCTR